MSSDLSSFNMRDVRRVILIVDDDENDRVFLERTLRRIDPSLVVRTVENGTEAMDYLEGGHPFADRREYPFPTFIFIDLKMPGLDGFAVLQHLKANTRWAIIPTIVFSASSDLDDIKKAFLCGACAYHVKPHRAEEREKLCRLLLEYWSASEVPQITDSGDQVETHSGGKLGERIPQP